MFGWGNLEDNKICLHTESPGQNERLLLDFAGMDNAKLMNEMEDRERVDAIRFREAGLGPLQKTYKYDPTKVQQQNPTKTMSAKSKS